MKREKISDAIGGIDPAYVEEAARHRAKSPVWIRWTAAAACVCLIAVAAAALPGLTRPVDPPVTDPGTVDPPVTDTNPPVQTTYDPFSDPGILWGEDNSGFSEAELPTLSNGVSVSWELLEALQDADGDRSIAVVVCGTAGSSTNSADSLSRPTMSRPMKISPPMPRRWSLR